MLLYDTDRLYYHHALVAHFLTGGKIESIFDLAINHSYQDLCQLLRILHTTKCVWIPIFVTQFVLSMYIGQI